MKRIFLVLILTASVGCNKEPVAPIQVDFKIIKLNDTSEVRVGQTVGIASGELFF